MNCRDIQEKLPALQDGELSADDKLTVSSHLADCAACRLEGKRLAESWALMNVVKPIEPSKDFEARFWARVRQEEPKETRWESWIGLKPLVPATLGIAGLVAVWILGVAGGLALFDTPARHPIDDVNGLAVLTSSFPPNSIEQVLMGDQYSKRGTL